MKELSFPDEFALRLPKTTRRKANKLADLEGISLEDFIMFAVAEKLARIDSARSADFARGKRKACRH